MRRNRIILAFCLIIGVILPLHADDLSNQYACTIAAAISDESNGTYEFTNDEDNWSMYVVRLNGTIWEENDGYRRSFINSIMSGYSDVKSTSGWYVDEDNFVNHDYRIIHSPNKYEVQISMYGSNIVVIVEHYRIATQKKTTTHKGASRKGVAKKKR